MKKLLIDLPEDIHTELSHMAVDAKLKLKNYLESVLVAHASGGSKKENLNKTKSQKARK
jgi:hypothetical protein